MYHVRDANLEAHMPGHNFALSLANKFWAIVGAVPTRAAVRGLKLRSALAETAICPKNCHLTDSFGFGSGLIRAGFCVVAWYRSIQ